MVKQVLIPRTKYITIFLRTFKKQEDIVAMQQRLTYLFRPSECSIFAEIYFPKKVIYMSGIYDALEEGLRAEIVKRYLRDNVSDLLVELRSYRELFNPRQYHEEGEFVDRPFTQQEARRRIRMYQPVVKGWSLYEVDGVFLNSRGRPDDERVQAVRLIFRPEDHVDGEIKKEAIAQGCEDVLQAMLSWVINSDYLLSDQRAWSPQERERFFERHMPWSQQKLEFAEQFFTLVMQQASKWVDDCALYVFGFLVRRFWNEVLRRRTREEEIWVTSFFSLHVNRVTRQFRYM
jgi:hypothetical protein